jgi:cytochrome c-type biogenesis protein CcmF
VSLRQGRSRCQYVSERRFYKNVEQPTTEVAIYSTLKDDLYLVFGGAASDSKAILQAFYNPLTMWVWIGAWVLALGTIIALLPNKKTSPTKRASKKAAVEESTDVEHAHS